MSVRRAMGPAVPGDSQACCWVCGAHALILIRRGSLPETLTAANFKITDSAYGCTADIFECGVCGFRQANTLSEVLRYYEEMFDDAYEHSRVARSTQARMLLRSVAAYCPRGRLLDVGAGSGILVDEAARMGFRAEGIEPSGPLSAHAAARGLKVHHGVLPAASVGGSFDIATVIDVIEHVSTPVELMRNVREALVPGGVAVVVTPDVSSMMARLLGWRWWHYRVAHIGYFNQATLAAALRAAGFETVKTMRPAWYFPASYLLERILTYLPQAVRFTPPRRLDNVTVPLNLFDSLLVVAKRV
jgi:2-polyprenyl-3-methyl-5-hydroxy-6-metoxy-1,4-benzoquinol methylase